ncbi:MAG TPA: glycogen operon protein GlgX [Pseudonocardiaceae bacterium]|jgi:hypothetical protein|nr:glycogen operon protein GlgX [Pseudonocardiaceae bacterium]
MTVEQQVRAPRRDIPVFPSDPSQLVVGDRLDTYYRKLFGWSVRWQDRRLFLVLENSLCAVTVPKLTSGRILDSLLATGCAGPILDLRTPQGGRLAILAETDGLVPPPDSLPRGVERLDSGVLLPLPMNPRPANPPVEWLRAPDPRHRWLPSMSAILASIQFPR